MDYFDGSLENMQFNFRDYVGQKKVISSLKPGSSALKYALSQTRFITAIIFTFFLIPAIFIGFMGFVISGILSGIQMFFGTFLFFFIFYILIMSMIFPVLWISARKFLKKTRTDVNSDVIDVRYWQGERLPEQVTIIPYKIILNVRPISDDEWKNDLKMKNIFRMIAGTPKRGQNSRFPQGTFKKDIHVIEMDRTMPVNSYKVHTGSLGRIVPLLAVIDQHIQETECRQNKIFFSLDRKQFNSFKNLVDKMVEKTKELRTFQEQQEVFEPGEEIDDSSFMDFFKDDV